MSPPAQEGTLHAAASPYAVRRVADRTVVRPGQIVVLGDAWVLLAVMWLVRGGVGTLDLPVIAFSGLAFACLALATYSRASLMSSALDDARWITSRIAIAYACVAAISALGEIGDQRTLAAAAVAAVPALFAGRVGSYRLESALRTDKRRRRVLILGAGEVARRLVSAAQQHPDYAMEIVGVADDDPLLSPTDLGSRLVCGLEDAPEFVASRDIDTVLIAFTNRHQGRLAQVVRRVCATGTQVWVVPRLFELGLEGAEHHLWGMPLTRVQPPAFHRATWALKRLIDVVGAAVGLVVAAPLLALIATAVYVSSGRPILFRQPRITVDGKPFDVLKFRTMAQCPADVDATEWCPDGDRITGLGRRLRDTSLDELPQLFNVLKGEMSLVGPRPERPHFVELFSERYPGYNDRHRVPAGITGWAQVHGLYGPDSPISDRACFDNHYIDNWSMWKDAKIVLKTFQTVLVKRKEDR